MARFSLGLLAVSVMFPIVGGLFVTTSPPSWLGIADVAVAAAFFLSTAFVIARAQRQVTDIDRLAALRANQVVVAVIPILLIAFFLIPKPVNWQILIIGLAWRAWLVHYGMPSLIAALRGRAG